MPPGEPVADTSRGLEIVADAGATRPLAVDLDGSLVCTDLLVEGFVASLFRRPFATVMALFSLRHGRAAFKERVAELDALAVESVPWHEPFLAFLKAERLKGRPLHLVTASHQAVAERVAKTLGIFESVEGSRDGVNLKGERKLAFLKDRFPEGFAYAGDSRADLPVWQGADSIILAGADAGTRAAAQRLGRPIEEEFPQERGGLWTWIRAARLHQWSKNVLIFLPLFLAHAYDDPDAILATLFGFVIFGVIASATYLVNDMADLAADRQHPSKRYRPLASGRIRLLDAGLVAGLGIFAGLVSAALLDGAFFVFVLLYLALTLLYSFRFKRVAMLDVFVIACLFTLRLMAGIALIGVEPSAWLLSFSLFLFLSLALAKRHGEIVRFGAEGNRRLSGRGYVAGDSALTLTFGAASGTAAVLVMLIYLVNEAFVHAAYAQPVWLWAIPPVLLLWILRIWLVSNHGDLDDDPVLYALRDPASLFLAGLVTLAFGAALL